MVLRVCNGGSVPEDVCEVTAELPTPHVCAPEHMKLLGGALFEELVSLTWVCLPGSCGELFFTLLSVTREVSQIPFCCLGCSAALGIPLSPSPMLQRQWNPAQSPAVFLPLHQQPKAA